MRLTAQQNAALLACGYQMLPATPWQVWHLSQQRRVFVLNDENVVVKRPDGFLETQGTLGALLEQHAQALAMAVGANPAASEAQSGTAPPPATAPGPVVRGAAGDLMPHPPSEAAPSEVAWAMPKPKLDPAGPRHPAPGAEPYSEPAQHPRDAAVESSAVMDQAKVKLLSEFEERAAALGLSVAGVMDDQVAATEAVTLGQSRRGAVPGPAKYRSPTGQEWSGRGRRPAWIAAHEAAGKNRDEFLIR